jgi:hypothetical protein
VGELGGAPQQLEPVGAEADTGTVNTARSTRSPSACSATSRAAAMRYAHSWATA